MLSKMTLRNFQCHEKLNIKFDEHVTTIVGSSDTGKSAVIRALKWLVTNKPIGNAFIREGTKKATVGLKFDDGRTIVRRKGESCNKMFLDEKEYKAFGTDVPEPINDALNLAEVNFQGQHDAPYWFSETAGQVSRQLNAIVNLDVIDETMKNLASELRRAKIEKESSEARLKEAEEEDESLSYVTQLSRDYGSLVKSQEDLLSKQFRLARIEALAGEAAKHETSIGTHRKANLEGLKVVKRGEKWQKKCQEVDRLLKLVSGAEKARQEASVEIPPMEDVEILKDMWDLVVESVAKGRLLGKMISKARDDKEELKNLRVDLIKFRTRFEEVSEGACPLCGNQIKEVVNV